jgi:predicted short-subunit dehydrogenase-like oxidoreductase (DUF2520 family)
MGISMAQALAGAGHLLVGITANTPDDIDRCDAMLNGVDVLPLGELLSRGELVLLALPDEELLPTIGGISDEKLWKTGQLVAHTSPSHGLGILSAAANAAGIPLAIHPAMRFSGSSLDLNRMRDSFFAVSAPKVALPIAQALVIEMGAEPVVIQDEQRAAYAEAFEVSTNLSALVVNQAIGLLESAGIENAIRIVAPSVLSAIEGALNDGHTPIDPADILRDE